VGVSINEIYVSLVIEEIHIGEENFRTLASSRRLSLGTIPLEELTWTSPMSFRYKAGGKRYEMSDIDKSRVKILEQSGS
jgi:hypothetical protein